MAGTADQTVLLIPVDELHAAAGNRVVGNVDDLAASIADLGVLQPLLVEPDPSGRYEVGCGARCLAAANEALRALVRKRLPKAAVFEHVLTQWVLQRSSNHVPARIACELLGLAVPVRKNSWGYVDYGTPLRQHAAKGPDQLARVGLALALGVGEEPLPGDWPNWSGEGVGEHFGFLQAQGYELAPIEQTKPHSSKPGPGDDGDEPDVQVDLDDSDVADGAP